MHEETPEETAEKFAKLISDLIDEERLAFEKAASVHKEGATIARNRPLAQDWFRASASLLAQFREQSRLGLTPEVPIEAIDRLANLAKHFADGREHPVAAAARDNERGYWPAERRGLAVAVFYARAAKAGEVNDRFYNKTIREAYGVRDRTVRRWIADGERICAGFAPPDASRLPEMLNLAGGQYRFNHGSDLDPDI